jgi:hypothetical protein
MIPANGGYATAAYVAAAVIYVFYAVSVRVRTRALRSRVRGASVASHDSR